LWFNFPPAFSSETEIFFSPFQNVIWTLVGQQCELGLSNDGGGKPNVR